MIIWLPIPIKKFGHKMGGMSTPYRISSPTTYPMSSALSVRGKSLYANMGDTGLEPVTPCLSSKYRVFSTIFSSAWFNDCYDAINYQLMSYSTFQILVIPVDYGGLRWSWLRFGYGLIDQSESHCGWVYNCNLTLPTTTQKNIRSGPDSKKAGASWTRLEPVCWRLRSLFNNVTAEK